MKKCALPPTYRIVTLLVIVLMAAASVFPLRAAQDPDQSPAACLIIGGGLLALALYLLLRTISQWGRGVSYDDQRIVFVLNRKDRREYRWEQIPTAGVTLAYPPFVPFFRFPDGKKLPLNPRMTGYIQLIADLRKRNFPAAATIQVNDFRDIPQFFSETFGQQFGGEDPKK